jgi:hypothetical protein
MTSEISSSYRFPGVRPQSLAKLLAAVVAGLALFVSAARADDGQTVRTIGSVSYVSGGVGTESLDQLRSQTKDFNLKLVFALKSGEFLSGVKVGIADAKGQSLLEATSEGPWFLAKLPAGRYQISASFAGNAETRKIAVDATKLAVIDFRWASE